MKHTTQAAGTVLRLRRGALLVEIMLGIALIALYLTASSTVLITGQEDTIAAGDRVRGVSVLQQAMGGVHTIRERGFSYLSNGVSGITQTGTGQWVFSGSSITFGSGIHVSLTMSGIGADAMAVRGRAAWKHGIHQSGSVIMSQRFTDWRRDFVLGDWSGLNLVTSLVQSGSPDFVSAVLYGDILYAMGGGGLYLYDVSDPANPVRVNSSFSLGHGAIDAVSRGNFLYILTEDTSEEIKVYDRSNAPTLTKVYGYNLQGSARALDIDVSGDILYISTREDGGPGISEFFSFDAGSATGDIAYIDELDDTSDMYQFAIFGTSALAVTDSDITEVRGVDITDPANLSLVSGQGRNLTGTQDGTRVITRENYLLVGREQGSSTELVLMQMSGAGLPLLSPGPWYRELSGSTLGLDADPLGCYAFAATEQGWKSLQIMDFRDTSLTELAEHSLTSVSGQGRSVTYNPFQDRLYFLSEDTLYVFAPTGVSPCT